MIHAVLALGLMLQEKAPITVEKALDAVIVKAGEKETVRYQLIRPADGKLSVESACYFHPFRTPSGAVITDVAPPDHKHHRGIFLAWFDMHGKKDADFWGWGQFAPVKDRVIVNRSAAEVRSDQKVPLVRVENHWNAEGETFIKETLNFSYRIEGGISVLDLAYQLTTDTDVRIAKGAFSGFCLRMRKDGKATAEGPDGEVKLPAPNHLKPETDWPAQPWYGFAVTLPDGAQLGGAVLNHPKNPAALWHNPAAIRMINPCIVAPKDVLITAAAPLSFKYRVLAWDGAIPREQINQLAKEWSERP